MKAIQITSVVKHFIFSRPFIMSTKAEQQKVVLNQQTGLKIIIGKVYFRKLGTKRVIFNVLSLLCTPGCFL